MTTIKYEINGTMVELEVEDSFASAYVEITEEEERTSERDKWRCRKKLTSLDAIEEMGGQIADPKSNIENAMFEREEQAERLTKLRSAMAHLLPEQRDLIKQVYFDGKKKRDIAAECGVTEQAIGQKVTRALVQLKKYFEKF